MGIVKISKKEADFVKKIILDFQEFETPLIEILHKVNDEYKCIPLPVSKIISEELGISMSSVNATATFYDFFSELPMGNTTIRVCEGASCVVNGAEVLTEVLKKKFNLVDTHTTEDNEFTVEVTYCNGHCDKSPTITVNNDLYTEVDVYELGSIVRGYAK